MRRISPCAAKALIKEELGGTSRELRRAWQTGTPRPSPEAQGTSTRRYCKPRQAGSEARQVGDKIGVIFQRLLRPDIGRDLKGEAMIATNLVMLRWAARITGLLLVCLVITFAVGEGTPGTFRQPPRVIVEFIALGLMLAGLLIGWRWEATGGVTTIAGFALFAATGLIVNRHLPGFAICLFLVPGLLFLASSGLNPPIDRHETLDERTAGHAKAAVAAGSLLRQEIVLDRDFADLLAVRLEAADRDLDAAERDRIGRYAARPLDCFQVSQSRSWHQRRRCHYRQFHWSLGRCQARSRN